MKVLLIHSKPISLAAAGSDSDRNNLSAGGVGAYLTTLAQRLREQGHGVASVRFAPPDHQYDTPCGESEHAFPGASRYLGRSQARRLMAVVQSENPDVIHSHSLRYMMPARFLPMLCRARPVVYSLHDVTPLCFWHTRLRSDGTLCDQAVGLKCLRSGCYRLGGNVRLTGDLLRVLTTRRALAHYRGLPLIVVPSAFIRDQLVINGFDRSRIEVVPLFSRFAGASQAVDASNSSRILCVSRLTRSKGVMSLLEAMTHIENETWQLEVVGDGPLRGEAAEFTERHGLADRVRFTGALGRNALAERYREAGMLVMPSLAPESFGLAGVEAMGFGLPVVAYDAGGVRQWLQNGVNGVLVERGHTRRLAEQIKRLLHDDALRRRMGAEAHRVVHSEFTVEHHVERVVRYYERCVEGWGVRS